MRISKDAQAYALAAVSHMNPSDSVIQRALEIAFDAGAKHVGSRQKALERLASRGAKAAAAPVPDEAPSLLDTIPMRHTDGTPALV